MNAAPLYYWIMVREHIRRMKEAGAPRPWSPDPILHDYRFCNVRREDDRGTIWIRQHIREPFANHPYLWFMLCIARQINWPDTLAELIGTPAWPNTWHWSPDAMMQALKRAIDLPTLEANRRCPFGGGCDDCPCGGNCYFKNKVQS